MNFPLWCLAILPLAFYLVTVGALNGRKTPVVVSGMRDWMTLGLALAGLVMVGPMQLFFPLLAFIHMGEFVWVLMLAMYLLLVVLVSLLAPPRLIIYNIAPHELRPVLSDMVKHLDPDARWAGDCLSMPNMGIQLYVSAWTSLRNVSLIAVGRRQNYLSWQQFHRELARRLQDVEVARNPRGLSIMGVGAVLIVWTAILGVSQISAILPQLQLVFPWK